jgi:GNAT superfamily N-acetyltransferase
MTVSIRLAQQSDAALLPDVERSAAQRFRELAELAWIADDAVTSADAHRGYIAQGTVWVADDRSAGLVGFLTAEAAGDELHIWELAVRHDFQGRGIGRRLVLAAVEAARARGLAALTLTTFRDIAWNEPFYARLGFETLDGPAIGTRLAAILEREAGLGLPTERRCAMRYCIRPEKD